MQRHQTLVNRASFRELTRHRQPAHVRHFTRSNVRRDGNDADAAELDKVHAGCVIAAQQNKVI